MLLPTGLIKKEPFGSIGIIYAIIKIAIIGFIV